MQKSFSPIIMSTYPFCSVIVLNYFGENVILNTIKSLLRLNYPKDGFEIIIVDNNSQDKSRLILNKVAKSARNIKLIFLNKNLGFSKGNNVGIKAAKGEYVALLNNDCVVDRNWLSELVKTVEKDKKIFAVNSKIKLYPRFLDLRIISHSSLVIEECSLLKSYLCSFNPNQKIKISGEVTAEGYFYKIPFDSLNDKEIEISFTCTKLSQNDRNILVQGLPKAAYRLSKEKINDKDFICRVRVNLNDKEVSKISHDLIQNAGIIVFQDGSGRDIGAIVRKNSLNYEVDQGQFEVEKEVYAACGAAVLYRKEILDRIGFLDEIFFMYYEDVEISERARLHKYKVVYSPKAVVRHIHALSSKEWSPFFIYNAEKGRLLHTFYSFPLRVFVNEYLIFVKELMLSFLNIVFYPGQFKKLIITIFLRMRHDQEGEKSEKTLIYFQYIKVFIFFIIKAPLLFLIRMRKRKNISRTEVWRNYNKILSGEWYLK